MNVASRRHRQWGTALGAVLALVLTAAQWLSLAHTHGPDGLTPECTVCEQAPAFAHAAAPCAAPLPSAARLACPATVHRLAAAQAALTPRARGPPLYAVPIA